MGKDKKDENTILKSIREGYNLPEAYFKVEVEKAVSKKGVSTVLNLQQLTGNRFENFYDTHPLLDRIYIIDMVQPLCGPMELQKTIINAHDKYGSKKTIFFIYNFESCIYLSKTTAKEFFQQMNLIRDFFMRFNAVFVFFVTGSTVKTMIQNAFDFYDWMKFTFTFVSESLDFSLNPIEVRESDVPKYSKPLEKIKYLKSTIEKTTNEKEKSQILLELGELYRQVGDYDAALEWLLKSLAIEERNNDGQNMAVGYRMVAEIFQIKNDPDKALEIVEKSNDRVKMALTCANIGRIYKAKGDNKTANRYFKRAEEIRNKT
jgi:tetratricopeptide (TPR) repeat protein